MPALSSSSSDMDVLTRFDAKLDEVNKGYLALFSERLRIEEHYADSLARLYTKSRAWDSLYDDSLPHPLPTSRQAWREIRDLTERESEARKAFIGALGETVVGTLNDLSSTQSRIRNRIKNDLKMANEMYYDQAEHKVPKLKKQYMKKCTEVDENKKQEQAIALQAKLLADPIRPAKESPESGRHELPNMHDYGSPPTINAPLPPTSNPALSNAYLADLSTGDSPSGGGRRRAGSAGMMQQDKAKEVLNDLAVQGKKQINAFISRFGGGDRDKEREEGDVGARTPLFVGPIGHAVKSSVDLPRSLSNKDLAANVKPSALKGVKLKREAEEADKAYREAVFHLETLRLRRNKIQAAANTSYDEFTEELCNTLKSTLNAYVDCLHATSSTTTSFCEHARPAISGIETITDVMAFGSNGRGPSSGLIAPTLYENYYVGACKSLIFGVSLNDYDYQRGEGKYHGTPPRVVMKCVSELDKRGLDAEGIHRISGRQQAVQALVYRVEQDEEAFEFTEKDEVYSISAVLKQYCRQLPEPIFHFPLPDRIRYTENRESHISSNFSALRARLNRMPTIHQTTFRTIVEHLARVAAHSSQNKMGAKNLALIFGNTLFGEDELPKNGDLANYMPGKDTVAEDLITYAPLLFGEGAFDAPVLPAGTALSRAGSMSYVPKNDRAGSAHTRAKLGSRHSSTGTGISLARTPSVESEQLSLPGPGMQESHVGEQLPPFQVEESGSPQEAPLPEESPVTLGQEQIDPQREPAEDNLIASPGIGSPVANGSSPVSRLPPGALPPTNQSPTSA